jgi:hypothetical protein
VLAAVSALLHAFFFFFVGKSQKVFKKNCEIGKMMIRLFALVALFLSMANAQQQDACSFPSTSTYYDYAKVMQCFRSVPFNENVRSDTLLQLTRAFELYTFLDIASLPPDPEHFSPPVDLMATFRQFASDSFKNDFEFHESLRSVFLQLHDAHTNYYAPRCYASFEWSQPINLVSYVDSSSQKQVLAVSLYFDDDLARYYRQQLNFDPTQWSGAIVEQINGADALQFVRAFADKQIGLSKDPSTRFNIALTMVAPYENAYFPKGSGAWLGLFTSRPAHFMLSPDADSVTWTVRLSNGSVEHRTFRWLARTSAPYANSASFMRAYWNPAAPGSSSSSSRLASGSGSSGRAERSPVVPRSDRNIARVPPPAPTRVAAAVPSVSITPIINDTANGVGAYRLGNDTMVFYLNTFEPENPIVASAVMIDAFLYAFETGIDKLIVDLLDNGGGIIELSQAFLSWMFPGAPNYQPTDMPSSPLARNLTETAARHDIVDTEWSPSFYQNQQGASQWANNDTSWLIPGIRRMRGNRTRAYSQLVHIDEDDYAAQLPFEDTVPFKPENILFSSSGFCGSSCANFLDTARYMHGVKTVVTGGFPGVAMSPRSFPGLEVLDSGPLYQILDALLQQTGEPCDSCSAPRQLQTTAGYRMCIREIYNGNDTSPLRQPLEYTWQPSEYRHNYDENTAFYHELLWPQLLQYFQ